MTRTGRWSRVGGATRTGLGFSLQLGTVRFFGLFLADPLDVPAVTVDYLAHIFGPALLAGAGMSLMALACCRPARDRRFIAVGAAITMTG